MRGALADPDVAAAGTRAPRLRVGPSSANARETYSSSAGMLSLCSALAIAESSSFKTASAASASQKLQRPRRVVDVHAAR